MPQGPRQIHKSVRKFSWKRLFLSAFVFLVLPGAVVYASIWTNISDYFTKTIPTGKIVNSQNVSLLAAAIGPDMAKEAKASEVNTTGGSALLPDEGPAGGPADIVEGGEHGQISTYVVREGDTFTSIAKMFDVSINTILWANNMSRGTTLTIGQTLVILPVTGVEHVVVKGDTLQSIAKKFKGDSNEIANYNGLSLGLPLVIDSTVIIPDGEVPGTVVHTLRPATSKLRGAGGPAIDGYYAAPLHDYRKSQGLHGYNGVDLVAYDGIGAPVYAAAEGVVVVARQGGYNGGYGNYVVIQHPNGTQTVYGHLLNLFVVQGEQVEQGQQVGRMGNSGHSTGPHLHFEVRGARNPF